MAEAAPAPAAAARVPSPWASLLAVAVVFAATLVLSPPIWETNDDPGMAMIAHGFGLAAQASPKLVYSNVLWGHFVQALDSGRGPTGYALAALAALFAASAGVLHGLRRLGAGWPLAATATLLVALPSVLVPQFTLTAGLLAICAALMGLAYFATRSLALLVASIVFVFVAFLVRLEECVLVVAVAAPLLPWREGMRDRRALGALAVAALAIAGAFAADRAAYADPEWDRFHALEDPRAAYTDFNVGDRLIAERPDVIAANGFTRNDIELVGRYFLADEKLADPARLGAMAAAIPNTAASAWRGGIDTLAVLATPRLLPLMACALALFALRPRWSLAAAWALFLAAMFALGASGRPGLDVLRVYVPALGMLLLAPMAGAPLSLPARRLALVAIIAALAVSAWQLAPWLQRQQRASARVAATMAQFPDEVVVVWGGAFPYRHADPPLGGNPAIRRVRLYSLGTDTWTPPSVALHEWRAGRGLTARLSSREGVLLAAREAQLPFLREYCREHLHTTLEDLGPAPTKAARIHRFRCLPGAPPSAGAR